MDLNTRVVIPDVEASQQWASQPTLYLNWYMELPDGRVLSNKDLRLVDFSGQENLSNPFVFTLNLHGNSGQQVIDIDIFNESIDIPIPKYKMSDLIGRSVTVGVCLRDSKKGVDSDATDALPKAMAAAEQALPFATQTETGFSIDDADPASDFMAAMAGGSTEGFSFFNGMVTAFSMGQPGVYSITMKPAIWRLMLTNDYRVHPQLSIRTAIEALMEKHQIAYNTQDLMGDSNTANIRVQDWLQAGETDYEFIQRLLAKDNIHYYFVHGPKSHQIVFSNKASYPMVFEDGRKLEYTYSEFAGVDRPDTLQTYNYSQEISSTSVKGCFTRQEAAWESDTVAGEMSFYSDPPVKPGDLPFHVYKIFQYGGSAQSVKNFSAQVAQMADSAATGLDGSSQNPEIRVGHKVQLNEGVHSGPSEVFPYLDQKWFVFTEAQHQASLDGTYSCKFKATEADSLITPFTTQGTHQGTVLAEVVAHCNGAIPSTWKYYEKSAFDPETSQASDSSASNSGVVGGIDPASDPNPKVLMAQGVFVRFTSDPNERSVFVKLSAGMQTCPEIGSMVIVSRASDDSELPEIQQSVQANGSEVVTPSGWTANTHVGSSYSTNYGDSKSIRYGRMSETDLDSAIAIITKQYDRGLFRDSSFSQGGGYSYSTSESGRSGMLSTSDSFGNSYSHHEGDVSKSYSDISLQESVSLNDTTDNTSTITSWSKSHHHNQGDTTSFSQIDGETKNTSINNGKVSNSSTNNADVENDSVNNGNITSSSLLVGTQTSSNTHTGDQISSNVQMGNQTSNNTQVGNQTSTSIHEGNVNSTSTQTGNITSETTHTGNTTSTSTQTGIVTNTNTQTGAVTNTNTQTGAVTNTNIQIGLTTNTSTQVGNSVSTNTVTGDVTNTSNTTGTETNTATRNIVKSTSNTTSSHSENTVGSAYDKNTVNTSNHISLTGATVSTSLVGVSLSTSLAASTNSVNIVGSDVSVGIIGQHSGINITGTGMTLDLSPGTVSIRLPGENIEIPNLHLKV